MPKTPPKIEALAAVAYTADTTLTDFKCCSQKVKNSYRRIVKAVVRSLTDDDLQELLYLKRTKPGAVEGKLF